MAIRNTVLKKVMEGVNYETEEITLWHVFFAVSMLGLLAGQEPGTPANRAAEAKRLADAMLDVSEAL